MDNIYYYHCKVGPNFGDILNPYLYSKLTGKQPNIVEPKDVPDATVYLMIGSIISHCQPNVVVWGSGIIRSTDYCPQPKQILAVRGPRTRKRLLSLGYNCPLIYGDPALLLPLLYKPVVEKKFLIGIIPHYVDFKFAKQLFSGYPHIVIINLINKDVEHVIRQINRCNMTISSSLHGIIVSHAYGIRSAWMQMSNKIRGDNVKYYDYYESVNIYDNKPLMVNRAMSVKMIKFLIDHYPNPKFPININGLKRTCPFTKTNKLPVN